MIYSLLAILVLSLVHLFAFKAAHLGKSRHARLLSAGSGVAIAYVFIDLLPKLADSEGVVNDLFKGPFPYLERHVYIMALVGFLVFFAVDRSKGYKGGTWISLSAYLLFNFLVGYAISDKDDPEVQPLFLFTFALALHYFSNDYSMSLEDGNKSTKVRWYLVLALFTGWLTGSFYELSKPAIALVGAFIAGGVIMNVTRHELPKDKPHSFNTFILAAIAYTLVLLS